MKSPREALSRFLKSCSQLCITSVGFPTGSSLQASLYTRNTHVGRSANFKLNSHSETVLGTELKDTLWFLNWTTNAVMRQKLNTSCSSDFSQSASQAVHKTGYCSTVRTKPASNHNLRGQHRDDAHARIRYPASANAKKLCLSRMREIFRHSFNDGLHPRAHPCYATRFSS
jgi:hypothetical protein